MTIDGPALRGVLRSHAAGVAVLTAAGPDGPAGVTITSFTSISATPALVSFALADTSTTWARIKDSRWFGIQLLGADQAELAARFATSGADRFAAPTRWHTGPQGVPLLDGCLSWLVCSRHDQLRLGDHHLVVGAVEHAQAGEPGDSLVHLHGALRPVATIHPART
ncbi:flavin reductase family protein [Streptantibioticus silvisoli]|uniref:Flavin reductase family protein n=1 Tax=Streptantibioticus silvisoli TaxID=2705255 RepID=A0ABT6W9Z5_9ACTN|nr:flavin reductase family protein [Streptantibioticus silvisoli]MDI5966543.1 flavin reductase family protein [Streptantibioticus silvisoli]